MGPNQACGESRSRQVIATCTAAIHAHFGPGVASMSKIQRSNKEAKKKSNLTAKEKKAVKRDKKQAGGHVPLIIKDV